MGFDRSSVMLALQHSGNNASAAANILVSGALGQRGMHGMHPSAGGGGAGSATGGGLGGAGGSGTRTSPGGGMFGGVTPGSGHDHAN